MEKNKYNKEGYREGYCSDGILEYAGNFVNGERVGLWKYHDFYGEIGLEVYYIR